MSRHLVPTTNVSFNSHLNPAFGTYSLNTMGTTCYPRRDSSGTQVDEFNTGDYFIRLAPVRLYDSLSGTPLLADGGQVRITSPFSLSYTHDLDIVNSGYVIDRSVHSTITLQHTFSSGNPSFYSIFDGWHDQGGGLLSSSQTWSPSLSLLSVYNATTIYAYVNF